MSAEMASSTETVEIFVPLLNEGVDVMRPTTAERTGRDAYRVLPTPDYDPESEEWQFPPGSTVKCVSEIYEGRRLLVARQLVA